jgi:D-arabinose 1-dehydrogenase-like Zn-dependent alcohol dehydrogenase
MRVAWWNGRANSRAAPPTSWRARWAHDAGMKARRVAVIGSGHLARRIQTLAASRGHAVVHLSHGTTRLDDSDESAAGTLGRALQGMDLSNVAAVYVVDDRDERNLEVLVSLLSMHGTFLIVASLFNEHVAPHLRAAHPNIRVLNPARIAAPAFIQALDVTLSHSLRYAPARIPEDPPRAGGDRLMRTLLIGFIVVLAGATTYFRLAERLSWLDALYFVIVSASTVGYGDITMLHASPLSKVMAILLLLSSTIFIWMIFSLTIDRLIKQRVQLALGRKRYAYSGHVVVCGLGRLGQFVAEGLLARGERLVIVEQREDAVAVHRLRALGADVYVGDARVPQVLSDVGVRRAKALYSLVDDDYVNLEIGLNGRTFEPDLRLILRMFDEAMSRRIKEHLDIHLTLSMTAIADEQFLAELS